MENEDDILFTAYMEIAFDSSEQERIFTRVKRFGFREHFIQ